MNAYDIFNMCVEGCAEKKKFGPHLSYYGCLRPSIMAVFG